MSNDNLRCRVYNQVAGFNLDVPDFSLSTLHSVFANPDFLKTQNTTFTFPKKYADWLLEEEDIKGIFKEVASFLGTEIETLIKWYFFYVINEDQYAFEVFAESDYVQKKVFVEAFRNFNKRYMTVPDSKNIIAPDILFCLIVYSYIHMHQVNEFEVPYNLLPLILNIVGVGPQDGYPEGFDPSLPYESDVYPINDKDKLPKRDLIDRIKYKLK